MFLLLPQRSELKKPQPPIRATTTVVVDLAQQRKQRLVYGFHRFAIRADGFDFGVGPASPRLELPDRLVLPLHCVARLLPQDLVQIFKRLVPQPLHLLEFLLFPRRDLARLLQPLRAVDELLHHANFDAVRNHVVVETPLTQLVSSRHLVLDFYG